VLNNCLVFKREYFSSAVTDNFTLHAFTSLCFYNFSFSDFSLTIYDLQDPSQRLSHHKTLSEHETDFFFLTLL
jgi:hypothetical protein